jgi:hypothetical protein
LSLQRYKYKSIEIISNNFVYFSDNICINVIKIDIKLK